MITLTDPHLIKTVLGGSTTTPYDKLVLAPITLDPVAGQVNASLRITSTSAPEMTPIFGTLTVNTGTRLLKIEVPQLDFLKQVTLTVGQNNNLVGIVTTAQNSLESGLITLGIVAGTQSGGV